MPQSVTFVLWQQCFGGATELNICLTNVSTGKLADSKEDYTGKVDAAEVKNAEGASKTEPIPTCNRLTGLNPVEVTQVTICIAPQNSPLQGVEM